MKRCPECGFRVKEPTIKLCPLCGVRLLQDPNGQTMSHRTHSHKEMGETCMLPNKNWETSAQVRYRAVPNLNTIENRRKTEHAGKKELPKYMKQLLTGLVIFLLYMLLQSCILFG